MDDECWDEEKGVDIFEIKGLMEICGLRKVDSIRNERKGYLYV